MIIITQVEKVLKHHINSSQLEEPANFAVENRDQLINPSGSRTGHMSNQDGENPTNTLTS